MNLSHKQEFPTHLQQPVLWQVGAVHGILDLGFAKDRSEGAGTQMPGNFLFNTYTQWVKSAKCCW